jgi:hypothetical protein
MGEAAFRIQRWLVELGAGSPAEVERQKTERETAWELNDWLWCSREARRVTARIEDVEETVPKVACLEAEAVYVAVLPSGIATMYCRQREPVLLRGLPTLVSYAGDGRAEHSGRPAAPARNGS